MIKKLIVRIFGQSVASRTTFLVLLAMLLTMLIAGFILVRHTREVVAEEVFRQTSKSMDEAIKDIDNRMSDVESAVRTAASYAYLFAPEEAGVNTLMERLIVSNQDIAAVTLLYRADYFSKHGRYFAPTTYRTADGSIEEDEIGGPAHDFCYLESDSSWVYTIQHDAPYWCLPYVDSMSTKRPMVTYSVPLHDIDGSTYAVLCADIDLSWVWHVVNKLKPFEASQVSVISRDGKFICHPDSNNVLSVNVLDFAHARNDQPLVEVLTKMLHGERGSDTLENMQDRPTNASNHEMQEVPSMVYYAPVKSVQWSVSFSLPLEEINRRPNQMRNYMIFALLLAIGIISIVTYTVIKAQIWPLKQLAQAVSSIGEGNFHCELPVIATNDEVAQLRNSFMGMQHSLSHYVEELQRTTISKASMENELKVASGIQMSMLPKKFPPFPDRTDIDVYGQLIPAKAVGGDLYDFYIRNEKLFFCIGDVSGKGVPASLLMAVTRALFRNISAYESQPERIVTHLNNTMVEGNDSNMFVTLFIGVLDLPTGHLRYANAGHDAPVLVNDSGTRIGLLPCDSNLPVGVMSDWKFTLQDATIDPGTTIFLYTDGLTEAENIHHELFGEERILKAITENQPPLPFIEHMTEAVHAFVGEAEQSDDLTMLAIRYTKQQLDVRLQRNITLPNDVEKVPELAAFIDEVCEAVGFDMSTTMSLNLAIEEAVVNVMNYAYSKGTVGNINIAAEANDERLKFTITDSGTPFDPTAKAEVDTTLSAEERPIGGLGIHLVRQIMDSINYERVDGKNILTLRKKLPVEVI